MGILIAITFLTLLLVLVVGTGVWLFDLDGRREVEAEAIQDRVAIALRREVGMVAVIPVAYVSRSSGTPDVVELHGRVPSAELRDAILRTARQELSRSRPDCRVHDRLAVTAEADLHAAA